MINENRTSLLRSGTSNKKPTTEKDLVMELWQNYVILACAVAQKGINTQFRCASPDPGYVNYIGSLYKIHNYTVCIIVYLR